MKRLFLLEACLVALASSPVRAPAGETQLAVVRITQCPRTVYVSLTQAEGKGKQWKFANGSTGKRLNDAGQGYSPRCKRAWAKLLRVLSGRRRGMSKLVGELVPDDKLSCLLVHELH